MDIYNLPERNSSFQQTASQPFSFQRYTHLTPCLRAIREIKEESIMRWITVILILVQIFGCSRRLPEREKTTKSPKYPWSAMEPEPYFIPDQSIFEKVNHEKYDKPINIDELNRFVKRAKEVVLQWGGNPDEVKIDEQTYKYVPEVHASENFIFVIFRPLFQKNDPIIFGFELKVYLRRSNEEVIEIWQGD
jgi:hypothetical protein